MQDPDPVSLEECDVRIARLRDEIWRVKCIRNSYSPISCLPTEILCKILICVRNISWDADGYAMIPPYVKTTTHVCRRWRMTAIDFPELWSRITFNVPSELMELQLQRAKKSLLDVVIPPPHDTSQNAFQNSTMLRPCSNQLRTLQIPQSQPGDIKQYVNNLRGVQASVLERLEIGMPVDDHLVAESTMGLPADLFAKGTPSLRHLSLRHAILPFTSTIFKGLCSLTIMIYDSSAVISLPQFLDALDSSPGLEKLKVEFKFSEHLAYTPRPQAVTLPKIKSFQLNATMSNCTAIVKHLMLPISAIIKITFIESDPRVNSNPLAMHEEFCAAIQQAWSSNPLQTGIESGLPSIRSMEYSEQNDNFILRFWLDDRQLFPLNDCPEPAISIATARPGTKVQSCYLVKHLPIENVTSLIIEQKNSLLPKQPEASWTRLSGLSSLAYLSLCGNSANSFFVQTLSGHDAAVIRFPHLTHMGFYSVDFGLAQYGHCLEDIELGAHPVHFDEQLMEFLRLRRKHDISIRKLCFEICTNFTDKSFQAVTQLVGDVDWDRKVETRDRLRCSDCQRRLPNCYCTERR